MSSIAAFTLARIGVEVNPPVARLSLRNLFGDLLARGRRAAAGELAEDRLESAAAGDLSENGSEALVAKSLPQSAEHDRGQHGQQLGEYVGTNARVARGDLGHLACGGVRSEQLMDRALP